MLLEEQEEAGPDGPFAVTAGMEDPKPLRARPLDQLESLFLKEQAGVEPDDPFLGVLPDGPGLGEIRGQRTQRSGRVKAGPAAVIVDIEKSHGATPILSYGANADRVPGPRPEDLNAFCEGDR